ncbi:MAG: FAD:protein FMN transferase [Coprococcus sp.]
MKKWYRIAAVVVVMVAVIAMVIISGVRRSGESEYTRNTITMGTAASFTVYGSHGSENIDGMLKLIDSLDKDVLSWRSADSEIYRVNTTYKPDEDITVSSELAGVLKQTLDISRAHDDLLDITIRPLADVWGIEDGRTEIPSQADIDIALRLVDVSKVSVDGDTLRISEPGMMLDLGAVGKGYGCDMAAEYLKGTDAAGACVALGGSIVVYGSKPDGTAWKVGVKDPRAGAGKTMGVISFGDGETAFVSTSGDYEKYFEQDGRRYHHILDPRTGYPAWNGTIAATVVCDNGLTSDALSTLCMLMDKDKAMKTIQEYGAEAVIIDEDKNVYVSEGLKDRFTITAEDYKLAE